MIASLLLQIAASTGSLPPQRFELPNGLRVWVQEDHSRPVALVQVTYKAGSINEQPGTTGIAHFVEHMVYRATKNIRNEDVYGYIDRIGGRYTGGTWPEYTRYAETVPSWALESAVRVTAERMCCALFDSTEFERERSNVVTEANGFSDTDPVSTLRDAVMYASFEAHPYRLNSNTWARDNLVLTRDEAFAWYKNHYGPNNAVLVITGDVRADDVRSLVEKHFASMPRAPGRGEVRVVEPPQRVEKRLTLTYPGAKPQMEIVYHAPAATHPDYPVLAVLSRVLAARLQRDSAANRLPGQIVVADSASEYPFVLRISVTQDSSLDLQQALSVIQSHMDRLGHDGALDEELAAAAGTRKTTPRLQASGQSSTVPPRRSFLTRIADSLSDGETMPWEVSRELRERILAAKSRVTSADIRAYVNRWLRPSQRTVGFLLPGKDDFVPTWSDGRPLVAERMEIPPLTTPPAKRMRPEAVPERALEALAPLSIPTARRMLANGVVVRSARRAGNAFAIHVRADSGARSDSGGHMDYGRTASSAREASAATAALARGVVDDRIATWPLTVAIVGPLPPAELLEIGARAFAGVPRERAEAMGGTTSEPKPTASDTASAAATQVSIVARMPGVPRDHPDRRALELLNYIVGVPSYGGRLGWALSKSGLTYYSAARTTFAARSGSVALMTTCDTRNTPATLQAIREVVAGVGSAGVEEWELREAQAFTLGRTLLYGARDDSDPDAVAIALLDSEYSGGVELLDLPALSRAYLSVSPSDINRVARKYYRPELLQISATGAVPRPVEPQIFADGTFRALFER